MDEARLSEAMNMLERALWGKIGNTWESHRLAAVTTFIGGLLRAQHAAEQRATEAEAAVDEWVKIAAQDAKDANTRLDEARARATEAEWKLAKAVEHAGVEFVDALQASHERDEARAQLAEAHRVIAQVAGEIKAERWTSLQWKAWAARLDALIRPADSQDTPSTAETEDSDD
jgi:hypothetical protein